MYHDAVSCSFVLVRNRVVRLSPGCMVHAHPIAVARPATAQLVAVCTAAHEFSVRAASATVAASELSTTFTPPRPPRPQRLQLDGMEQSLGAMVRLRFGRGRFIQTLSNFDLSFSENISALFFFLCLFH